MSRGFGDFQRGGGGIYEDSSFVINQFIKIFQINKKRGFYCLKVSAISFMVQIIESISYRNERVVNEIVVCITTFHIYFEMFVFAIFFWHLII